MGTFAAAEVPVVQAETRTVPRAGVAPRLRNLGLGLLGVAVAVAGWQAVVAFDVVGSDVLSPPREVVDTLVERRADLLDAARETLRAWFVGLAYAVVLGGATGVLAGSSRWFEALTSGLLRFLRPLPSVALIPVVILILGLGQSTVSTLAAYAGFWPIFIGALYGVRNVEPQYLETARTLRLGFVGRVRRVVLPAALPSIISGIRVAVALCLVVGVSAEVIIGGRGLGGYVLLAQQGGNTPNVYAGILAGGLLGWLLSTAFAALQRRAVRWSMRSEGR